MFHTYLRIQMLMQHKYALVCLHTHLRFANIYIRKRCDLITANRCTELLLSQAPPQPLDKHCLQFSRRTKSYPNFWQTKHFAICFHKNLYLDWFLNALSASAQCPYTNQHNICSNVDFQNMRPVIFSHGEITPAGGRRTEW